MVERKTLKLYSEKEKLCSTINSFTSVFTRNVTALLLFVLLPVFAAALMFCGPSCAEQIEKYSSEPEVKIGVVQKTTHARLSFKGSFRIYKASEPVELYRGDGETIQVELYTVRLKELPARFRVSVGQYRSFEQAEFTLMEMGRVPYESLIVQPRQWSLWFGPFNNFNAARFALEYFRGRGYLDSRIEPESTDIPVLTLYAQDGSLIHLGNDPVVAYPEDERFRVNNREYRGRAEMRLDLYGTFSVINRVKVEDYLYSVLPREMPSASHPESLKAQAVIARTYLMNNLRRHMADGFSLCNTTDCQVYGGVNDEVASGNEAVKATRGQVLVYDGRLANALFHSTCGGRTAAYDDVWSGGGHPYLTTVDDGTGFPVARLDTEDRVRKYLKHKKAHCSKSKYFRWEKSYTHSQLLNVFKQTIPEFTNNPELQIEKLHGVKVLGYSDSGRVTAVEISTDKGKFVFEKDKIRWVMGNLKSTLFVLDVTGTGDSRKYALLGAGWGHGLGLCQIGAMQMGRDGYKYDRILSLYYTGTKIFNLWD
ncbi:MAG TPA: SpoIID/LytB domain-containing protein [bacterium]|nr:SpoIID/LytB domain-containing protein [bacterium]